jgi:hypothetical protein
VVQHEVQVSLNGVFVLINSWFALNGELVKADDFYFVNSQYYLEHCRLPHWLLLPLQAGGETIKTLLILHNYISSIPEWCSQLNLEIMNADQHVDDVGDLNASGVLVPEGSNTFGRELALDLMEAVRHVESFNSFDLTQVWDVEGKPIFEASACLHWFLNHISLRNGGLLGLIGIIVFLDVAAEWLLMFQSECFEISFVLKELQNCGLYD